MRRAALAVELAAVLLLAGPGGDARAIDPRSAEAARTGREFFLPELYLGGGNLPLAAVLDELPNSAAWRAYLADRGDAPGGFTAFVDPRSGAATSLIGAMPLLPGGGVGNEVTLAALGARLGRTLKGLDADVVAAAAGAFLDQHAALLGIDRAQTGMLTAVEIHPDLWQVSAGQRFAGLPVRHARLVVTVVRGNVVVAGTEAWGRVALDPAPRVSPAAALAAGFAHAGPGAAAGALAREPRLEIVPVAPPELQAGEAYAGPIGSGYRHRLVWTFELETPPSPGRWEAMVDAHTGELIAFQDLNHYLLRQIRGAVYPNTSTGICPDAGRCGVMQPGWPMPWADTGLPAPDDFADGAGVFDWAGDPATTTLTGRYVRVHDTCGPLAASSPTGDIDLGGANGEHDCTTPGSGGAGNTAAARANFYELNRIAEQARGWLPGNAWLGTQMTSNVNREGTCGAYYEASGGTINLFRAGSGCRNTGELAGVFDHEWGHALDDNDAGGSLSNSTEGYADIAMLYRLQTSCVGYGLLWTADSGCGQTSDGTGFNAREEQLGPSHCDTDCSGVRDADWARHVPDTPDTALGFVCSQCIVQSGPCGRQSHCASAPVRQAAWDLVTRDLAAPPFGLDRQSAFLVGARLFYQGSGVVGLWYACTCGGTADGCGATNGYLQWLAADDDNGNLADGTPHMTAIHAAFDRHGIACNTPAPVDSGCAGGPATPPTLTVTPGSYQNQLSWTAVAGAHRYWVMRTEGHAGCDYGKARIADLTGTSYTDSEVANGRTYYYDVVAQGASAACFTPLSGCVAATPTAALFADGFETGDTTRWSLAVP